MRMWGHFKLLIAFLIFTLLPQCIGGGPGGPAAPPSAPVEIPSFLQFPEDVSIDVGKVGTAQMTFSKFVAVGDDISEAIEAGAKFAAIAFSISRSILEQLTTVEVRVDPTVTTFQDFIIIDEELYEIRIDFGRFDLDGDGVDEDCPGCTCPVGDCDFPDNQCPLEAELNELRPICYRVWLRNRSNPGPFERFLAGILERFPTRDDPATAENEENPGNGQFRFEVRLPNPLLNPLPLRFSVTSNNVIYNHLDPTDPFAKSTELLQFGEIIQTEEPVPFTQQNQHLLVEQLSLEGATSEDELLKTIRATSSDMEPLSPTEGEETHFKYIARYREDQDFWSGSVESTDPDFDFNFTSACARISSGLVIEQDNCLDSGIDVGAAGLEFLDFVDRSEAAMPDFSEFPEDPDDPTL